jgi:hypothetical protein
MEIQYKYHIASNYIASNYITMSLIVNIMLPAKSSPKFDKCSAYFEMKIRPSVSERCAVQKELGISEKLIASICKV